MFCHNVRFCTKCDRALEMPLSPPVPHRVNSGSVSVCVPHGIYMMCDVYMLCMVCVVCVHAHASCCAPPGYIYISLCMLCICLYLYQSMYAMHLHHHHYPPITISLCYRRSVVCTKRRRGPGFYYQNGVFHRFHLSLGSTPSVGCRCLLT